MSKKGLFMIAMLLGLTAALLALAAASATSGGTIRAEVADGRRLLSAQETDLAAVYAQKDAGEGPVLEQGTGPATTGESDYAAVPETGECAGLVTGYPKPSVAITYAIKVARDDAVQLPSYGTLFSANDHGQLLRATQAKPGALAYAEKIAASDIVQVGPFVSLLALDDRHQIATLGRREFSPSAYAAKIAEEDYVPSGSFASLPGLDDRGQTMQGSHASSIASAYAAKVAVDDGVSF
ncbi:MAG: hypothetical protein ABSG98_00025 [Anaerolineales bacterium]|jgi:hypothetical protein